MNLGKISIIRIIIISILTVLYSVAFAIAVHAILPSSVNAERFDSTLV
jgi:hypothetical protein